MNFIDKIKIKRNPNIIDNWNHTKINEDTIKFAIDNGYKFNPQTINQFELYLIYRDTFKYEQDFLEYQKNRAKKNEFMLAKINDIYGKDEFIEILKQDDELARVNITRLWWSIVRRE